jgi:ribulose-phosphate 3-epimerase
MQKEIIVAPSVLSADFLNLQQDLTILKNAGIEWIHYDVMDYHFVPNLSFGPSILKQINSKFNFKIDAHLMIETKMSLAEYLAPFLDAGVHQVTLHFEALSEKQRAEFISWCKENNVKASFALKPNTDINVLAPFLENLDNILIMSVEPGFGGQKFIPYVVKKIKELDKMRSDYNFKYLIEIDGGINESTIHELDNSGIDMIVAGSYLFGQHDLLDRIEIIKNVK